MSLDARMLPADTLLLDGRNARKGAASDSAIAEMEASIRAYGVLVPLLVVDNKCGDYSVLDGGDAVKFKLHIRQEEQLVQEIAENFAECVQSELENMHVFVGTFQS